jgi:hypothetical protein
LQGVLGPNPFPNMAGRDLAVFESALQAAKDAACRSACDGALQNEGIRSLAALVRQMVANTNVYDGRTSTYPIQKQTVSKYLSQGESGAVVLMPVPMVFLGDYFFNPTNIQWIGQQRALILLHESVHQFGSKGDKEFGGSRKLSERIAEKCFPAIKAIRQLRNLAD